MSIHFFNPDDIDNDDREAMVDVSVEGTPGREIPKNRWFVVRRGLCWDEVDDNIRQPDPGRLVLCACIHDYGCICYGYHDEIKAWSRTTLIFAVVFAILTTPLALLCFLPALCFLKKADQGGKDGNIADARAQCNLWLGCFIVGVIWSTTLFFMAITFIIIFTTVRPENTTD